MKSKINSKKTTPSEKSISRKNLSRRNFLKTLALGGVAFAGAGVLAKGAYSLLPKPDFRAKYRADVVPGDRAHQARKHVVMTKKETRALIKFFKDSYRRNA